MKQRMAALTALCLTGTLLLSGGWSQTVLASTVSDVTSGSALDTAPDAADDTQPADGGQEEAPADGQEAPVADEPETPEADQPEEVPEEQQELDELLLEDEQLPVARYEGITIDGDFSDWDARTKTAVTTGHSLSEVDMIWDGDYIYLYFKVQSGNWNAVTWDGPNSNGQFAITTDLGRTLLVQLASGNGPFISGVEGAQVAVDSTAWGQDSYQWEVAIPSKQLPPFQKTISFGFYLGETFISDVANLQGTQDEEDKTFNGIVYDGMYGDWKYYPHTVIEYSTPGTQEHVVDSEGALYATNGKLYAHATTTMPEKLQEQGGEFTKSTLIRVNGKSEMTFRAMFVGVNANGDIDYHAKLWDLAPGTYEFYMLDATGWTDATNISQLQGPYSECHNAVFGRMYVTVSPSQDDMEYEVDLSVLADRFGISPDEIRTLEGHWERLGDEWIYTAGTPTGAGVGLFLCLSTTGLAYVAQRKRKKQV